MTAEIAILNKTAVALAADSAVTIQTPGGHKIYNTVNKLFTLSKYRPVGVMVYGNSEFMGIPWESIIKEHRRELGDRSHGTLREYVDGFISWLHQAKLLFPRSLQNQVLEATAQAYFNQIRSEIETSVAEVLAQAGSINDPQVAQITENNVRRHHEFWTAKERLNSVPDGYEQQLLERHSAALARIREGVFEKLSMPETIAKMLTDIVPLVFSRNHFQPNDSGIVMAGFGEQEVFPSVMSFTVETLVDDCLKWRERPDESAHIDQLNNASIVPFAQREMVDTFLSGIDPNYKGLLLSAVGQLLQRYSNEIFKGIPDAALPKKKDLVAALQAGIPGLVQGLDGSLRDYGQKRHIAPIMNAVGALPKDELAAMAESLVNLTSFKRRISMDAETVGGEIDVAVISKGDGFIWIKRNHYFDAGKNPHFMVNYYR